MPPPDREDLRRLHFVNALFSHVTGHDLYLAQQIKEAITFSLSELETQVVEHPESASKFAAAFNASAATLLENLCHGLPRHGFFHWDASRTLISATPLFARAEIMAGLKALATYRESTFLVTNLRPALLPPDRRATPCRKQAYDDTLAFIRDLAAARTAPTANLQLLFL